MALIKKHEAFCQEYIKDLIGAQAAIRAGYSKHTARITASKLLTKPNVKERIQSLMDARSKATRIDAEYVIKTITKTILQCQEQDKPDHANILRGIELLGRHLRLFTDRVQVINDYDSLSDQEVERELAAAQQENSSVKAETEEVPSFITH